MTVANVRLLCANAELYDRATAVGDGSTDEFRAPQAPVVSGSVRVFVAGTEKTETTHFTIDYAQGTCRFTAGNIPTAGQSVVITYRHVALTDAELQSLLTLEGDSDRLAAAQALDVMATRQALLGKVRILDLQVDGPAVAAEMRKHAAELRRQVEEGVGTDAADSFDWAEMVLDTPTFVERVTAEALRQ